MAKSPTQRTLERLRADGYRVDVVERWIPRTHRRADLFGVIDVLAIGHHETLAVQTTTGANVAARRQKMIASDSLADMQAVGWRVVIHGWRRNARQR